MRVRRASNSKRQVQHHYLVDHLKDRFIRNFHFGSDCEVFIIDHNF